MRDVGGAAELREGMWEKMEISGGHPGENRGCRGGDSDWVPALQATLQPLLRLGQRRKRGLGPRE